MKIDEIQLHSTIKGDRLINPYQIEFLAIIFEYLGETYKFVIDCYISTVEKLKVKIFLNLAKISKSCD